MEVDDLRQHLQKVEADANQAIYHIIINRFDGGTHCLICGDREASEGEFCRETQREHQAQKHDWRCHGAYVPTTDPTRTLARSD